MTLKRAPINHRPEFVQKLLKKVVRFEDGGAFKNFAIVTHNGREYVLKVEVDMCYPSLPKEIYLQTHYPRSITDHLLKYKAWCIKDGKFYAVQEKVSLKTTKKSIKALPNALHDVVDDIGYRKNIGVNKNGKAKVYDFGYLQPNHDVRVDKGRKYFSYDLLQ